MKNNLIAISTACVLALTTATQAGNLAEPVMEMAPAAIVEETAPSSSTGNLIIPLIFIALIAAAASGDNSAVPIVSDSRTKTDIVPVGTAANGLPIYQYRYIGAPTVFEGVMAQDVLTHTPAAVMTHPSGYLTVNYAMLGLDLKIVE